FLAELSRKTDEVERARISDFISNVFRSVDQSLSSPPLGDYRPIVLPASVRNAVYSANLLLLSVIVEQKLKLSVLLGYQSDVVTIWRRYVLLWKSQLSSPGWESFVSTLELRRLWNEENRDIELCLSAGHPSIQSFDPEWLLGRRGDGSNEWALETDILESNAL